MRRGLPSFNERDATGRDGGEDGFEGGHELVFEPTLEKSLLNDYAILQFRWLNHYCQHLLLLDN